MSTEDLVRVVGEQTNRRGFLRRAGAGALGITFGILGLPKDAFGANYKCCSLCKTPPQSSCSCGVCSWCWTCCWNNNSGSWKVNCCEYYTNRSYCNGSSCTSVCCSTGNTIGKCGATPEAGAVAV